MKRKVLRVLTLLCLVVMATGCVKYNATIEIKEDKSMNFDIIYAFNIRVFGSSELLSEEERNNIEENGFEVADYEEDTMKGFTISKKFSNIDNVSSDKKVEYDLGSIFEGKQTEEYFFQIKKSKEKNIYTAIIKFDSEGSSLNDSEMAGVKDTIEDNQEFQDSLVIPGDDLIEQPEDEEDDDDLSIDYSDLMNFDLKFVVKLPNAAISNNATNVSEDGKTLEWELTTEEASSIEFSFEIMNENNSSISDGVKIIIIGILVVVVIVIVIVVLRKNKKGNGGNKVTDVQQVTPVVETAPVTPVQPQQVTPVEVKQVIEPSVVQESVQPQPVQPVQVTQQPSQPQPVTPVVEPTTTVSQQSNNQQQ